MNRLRTIILLSILLALTGCFELEQIFTLNPDGSGKVEVKTVFHNKMLLVSNSGKSTPQEKLVSTIASLLEESKGIEAWKDVTYRIEKNDRVYFQATAYFNDINQLELHNTGVIDVALNPNAQGRLFLQLGKIKKEQTDKPSDSTPLTEQQLHKKMTKAKNKYQLYIIFLRPLFTKATETMIFYLPSKILTATGDYQTEPDGAVSYTITGAEILKEVDAIMRDDDRLADIIISGGDPLKDAPFPPANFTFEFSTQPLFDYQQEVAEAQAAYPEIKKKLGMTPAPQNSTDADLH